MSNPSDLVEKLNDIWRDDDHERGCEGRNYTCSCGFDERAYETARLAADALAAKDAEIARLTDEVKAASVGLMFANAEIDRLNDALNGDLDA